MKNAALYLSLALVAAPAAAQEITDEALSECQSRHGAFTEVKACLAPTQMSLNMLAAVGSPDLLGPAGAQLVAACGGRNEDSVARWLCVKNALEDARELLAMIGDPARIEDPLFAGVAQPEAITRVFRLHEEQSAAYPLEDPFLGMYVPLGS